MTISKSCGDINSECPAGKSPRGSCKNLAAFSYALEDNSTIFQI